MKINFVLPGAARVPVGGYKVVFAYANGLAARGREVTLILPALGNETGSWSAGPRRVARYLLGAATHAYRPDPWFRLRRDVLIKWVPSLHENHVPDADVIIATGWPTARPVAAYGAAKGRKFYLIQHFESWWGNESEVTATWRLPMRKIVVARWLEEKARQLGETARHVANGLDPSEFAVDLPIEERDAHRVLMLYHESRWKGSTEGLAALAEVRKRVPTLRSCLFGVSPAPDHLPGWITYVRNPSRTKLRALYNEAAIFLSPSWTEGWPLPPAEAMMSGCALVATDIAGHREYAEHDVTALLAPAGQPQALAEQLALLLTDDSYRRRIAAAGLRFIAQFTWDRAVSSLESILAADDREPGAPLLGGSLAA